MEDGFFDQVKFFRKLFQRKFWVEVFLVLLSYFRPKNENLAKKRKNSKSFGIQPYSPSSPLKGHLTSSLLSLNWRFNVGFIGPITKWSITSVVISNDSITSNGLINFIKIIEESNWTKTLPQILYNDILIIMSYDKVIEPSLIATLTRLNSGYNKFWMSFSVGDNFFWIRWNWLIDQSRPEHGLRLVQNINFGLGFEQGYVFRTLDSGIESYNVMASD